MPYQTTPPVNLAEFGLILDKPSNSTPPNAWSDSLNMRAKDGSVQGVLDFENSFDINDDYNGVLDAKPIAVTQWTPAGTDHLNIAYIIASQKVGEVGKGRVFVYNVSTSVTVEITNATSDDAFIVDMTYPPQIFVFNELLVVNPGTGTPQMITADAETNGNLVDLPGWEDAFPDQYARIMKPFGNRLVAMNFHRGQRTSNLTDDRDFPVLFAWSNPVAVIGSLADDTSSNPSTSGAQWQKSTTNTAGFNFLVATPGGILDAYQLGDELFAYKSDAVVRVSPTNDGDFDFASILEDDGIYSTRCVAQIGNSQQIVMGNYGVYIQDGRGDKTDLAKGIFQDALYNDIKPADKDRTFVFHQTRDKEVWFCYSSITNTGEGCDTAFVYDYKEQKVHKRSLPNITDMFETEINGVLSIYATKPDTKQIQILSTTDMVAGGYLELRDKALGNRKGSRDIIEVLIDSEEAVKLSLFGELNIKNTTPFPDDLDFDPETDYKVDVRINGKFFTFRLTMNGTTNPKLTTIAVRIREVGRR